jgi:hypothetical protein
MDLVDEHRETREEDVVGGPIGVVTKAMGSRFASLRSRGLVVQSVVLGLAVVPAYAVVAPVAAWHRGAAGLVTAAAAAAFCLLGAVTALVVGRHFRQTQHAWLGMAVGMLPRMGIPITLGLIFQLRGGLLAESGLLVYLVVFYPVTLGVEAALCLPSGGQPGPPGNGPRSAIL